MKTAIRYSFVVWIIFGLFMTWIIWPVSTPISATLRITSLVIPQMVMFYLNLLILLPKYLDKNKKTIFLLFIVLIVLINGIGGGFIDIHLDENYPIALKHFNTRPLHIVFIVRFMTAIPPLVISALIGRTLLLKKRNEESLELERKMLEAETKALKAQINPHFLFNTLNNIYSLAQQKSDKTPDAILQLSELLRYVTYDGNQNLVKLDNEIKVINNIIQLQYLKDDYHDNIEIDIDVEESNLKIAPLVLIPFIENCFKHSNFEDHENGWIKIKLKTVGEQLVLESSNSIGHQQNVIKDSTGGIGMDNVKKRLNLLYKDSHELTIQMDENSYKINLKITLEK